jgi:hypothetical protein
MPTYVRTNYRTTGDKISVIGSRQGKIAHGEYSRVTANATATALALLTGSTDLLVPTGLKAPKYGVIMPWESDSGMTCHKGAGLFYSRCTGSYLVLVGLTLTSTATGGNDSSSVTWCYSATDSVSFSFVWVAFED